MYLLYSKDAEYESSSELALFLEDYFVQEMYLNNCKDREFCVQEIKLSSSSY